ncbi:hypothetical protein A2246_03510 [candidate division WOR-1 bacterium RIFOXYA2_FULL_37_7]|nr:MAG: hypothetical protein A2246_03510 [candidate division WOR-1 bacterium RIFOXYA2_FULL_37_7]
MDVELEPSITITFDKSHLITIGERLYAESIELIRELVNNAYDADASVVKVSMADDKIVIEDDGSGMNREGLSQYFNIGSTEKKKHSKSPKFNRIRIGEFGIGKFASLAAAAHFEISTRRDDFAATVIFDKESWEASRDQWHIPLRIDDPNDWKHNGTKVVLTKLSKKFDISDVERRILEGVPIKAENFAVYLNGKRIVARFLPGHRIPIFEGTDFGSVSGEIIIVSNPKLIFGGAGIEVKVKGVTVKKELFGMEMVPNFSSLTGEVHADFLTVTSDRTNFVLDSSEYKGFYNTMRQVLQRIAHDIKYLQNQKEKKRGRNIANAAVERVKEALRKNPNLAELLGMSIPDENEKPKLKERERNLPKRPMANKKKTLAQKKILSKVLGPSAVVTKFKMGNDGFTCQFDHFGEDVPESYTEGSIIYINIDHPLYKRESKHRDRQLVNVARLLTQEISLLNNPKNSRQAFELQSRLLTETLIEK